MFRRVFAVLLLLLLLPVPRTGEAASHHPTAGLCATVAAMADMGGRGMSVLSTASHAGIVRAEHHRHTPDDPGHRHTCSGACCCAAHPLDPSATALAEPACVLLPANGPVTAVAVPLPRPNTHLFPDPNGPPRLR